MLESKRVLLVDDDLFALGLLDQALKSEGYETVACHNGEEALAILKKKKFDAVITDIIMPEKDGIDLLNNMRALDIQTPVIGMSGNRNSHHADDRLDFACYFAGDILQKPVRKDEILDILKTVL